MTSLGKLHRHLDPGTTLAELIFGLLMVLTFTLGARLLGPDEPTDGRELMIAAIGCNIAWGIIDGFLFVLGNVYERLRVATLTESLRVAKYDPAAIAALQGELGGSLSDRGDAAQRDRFYISILAAVRGGPAEKPQLLAEDLRRGDVTVEDPRLVRVPAVVDVGLVAAQAEYLTGSPRDRDQQERQRRERQVLRVEDGEGQVQTPELRAGN